MISISIFNHVSLFGLVWYSIVNLSFSTTSADIVLATTTVYNQVVDLVFNSVHRMKDTSTLPILF